jgi:hypothetical protein
VSAAARLLSGFALVLAASTGVAHSAVSQTINAGIDQNQELTMSFTDGTPIGVASPPGTLIPPGAYQVNVNDGSDIGNVDLDGPGISDATGVDTLIQLTWNVTFQPCSIYSYTDDTVATSTEWFQTSASATSTAACASAVKAPQPSPVVPTTTASTKPSNSNKSTSTPATRTRPLEFRGTLAAHVSGTGFLSLALAGKSVRSLRSGKYSISVVDDSHRAGFTLQESSEPSTTLTSTTFVGKRTRTVALRAGQWFFYPSFVGRKTYFVVTT